MKPRTKIEREVVDLSHKLGEIGKRDTTCIIRHTYGSCKYEEMYNRCYVVINQAYKGWQVLRYIRKRAVSHAPRNTVKQYTQRMTFWMEPAIYERLDALRGKRAKYVRDAVVEKLERDGNPIPPDPHAKDEGHPDRRYHRMFKNLPQSVRTYNARETYRSPLTITKTPENLWRVSYGEYTTQQGAPSVEHKDLLSALEWLDKWIKDYGNKWVVGKVIKKNEGI